MMHSIRLSSQKSRQMNLVPNISTVTARIRQTHCLVKPPDRTVLHGRSGTERLTGTLGLAWPLVGIPIVGRIGWGGGGDPIDLGGEVVGQGRNRRKGRRRLRRMMATTSVARRLPDATRRCACHVL